MWYGSAWSRDPPSSLGRHVAPQSSRSAPHASARAVLAYTSSLVRVPAATAMFFDLGVFGLVVGATVLTLIALAHQSVRKLRAARTTTAQAVREEG